MEINSFGGFVMSIKFVHTSDIHIGRSFGAASFGHALGHKRRAELKETFFKILDLCKEEGVQLLLIAGDLFESDYVDTSDLKDLQKKFEELEGVHIVIGAGNHDAIINATTGYNMLTWSENVHVFQESLSKYSIQALNVDIYSFSWNKKEIRSMSFEELVIEDDTKTNILMLHGDIYTQSPYLPLNILDLQNKRFDYIALGHIHKPDVNAGFAYCGCPEPLDFKETGEHGIIEGVIEDGQVTIGFRPIAKRSFVIKTITINPDMSFEQVKGMALSEIHKDRMPHSMYRLIIEGIKDEEITLNIDIIKEILETQIFYCEVIDQTQSNYDIEGIKRDNEGNLIGDFVRYMEERGLDDPQIKDALYEGLNILLSEKVN
ncbi:MAG: DNA repair exonuclease [Firmicutes bacterium HGW-Firmicutes-1]|nr:MAG: DNA repair exonuclease [Firmicutes bacterium HGW-Firmicutes-1]